MLALRARILADLGAYLMPATGIPPRTMATLMTGCYAIEHAEVEVLGARTDKVPTGPYRGAGRPEAAFVLERTVDAAARELGMDPVELRRRNLIREFPHETPLGFSYDSGDYERCLDLALDLVEPAARPPRLIGTGVALYVERAAGQWESAKIGIEEGGIVVSSSASPHGQGHDITFAQVAADRLGVVTGPHHPPLRRVRRASARSAAARPRWRGRRSPSPPTSCSTAAALSPPNGWAPRWCGTVAASSLRTAVASPSVIWSGSRPRRASPRSWCSPPAPTPRWSRSSARPAA